MKNCSLPSKHKLLCNSLNVGFISIILLGGTVHAADVNGEKSQELTTGGLVGVGVANVPAYLGSDQRRNQAIIPIDYRWSNGAYINGKGLGFNASSYSAVQYGPLLNVGAERKECVASALRGMGDVQANLEYGGYISAHVATGWEVNMTLLTGSGVDRMGGLVSIGTEYKTRLSQNLQLSMTFGANYANAASMNTYFGVDSSQSRASGYSIYQLSDGLRDINTGLNLSYQITPAWFVLSGVSISTLSDAAKKSPIVRMHDGATGFIGLAHAF